MSFADDQAAMQARAETVLAQAQGYLNSLVQTANSILVEGTTVLPVQYDYASVPQVNLPISFAVRPTITTPTIGSPTAPLYSFSSLENISLPADDLTTPTAEFQFFEAAYESILLDPLKVKLLDNLTNGGYGIETVDEIALFNRARDREITAMQSRIDDAGRTMAARGFPLPPGELAISVDRAYQEMQDKVSSVSRDITLERSKLYVENRQFTIREVREIETVTLGFHNSVQERAFNVAKATVDLSIALYNTLLERYKARLYAAKITSDVDVQRVQAQAEQARIAFDSFRSQVQAYEVNIRSLLDSARLNVEAYRADVDSARSNNDAFAARATLQAKVLESTTQQNIQISQMTIENAKTRLLGVVESLKFRTSAAEFGSKAFFAQLTAIESTVNALTTESTTV